MSSGESCRPLSIQHFTCSPAFVLLFYFIFFLLSQCRTAPDRSGHLDNIIFILDCIVFASIFSFEGQPLPWNLTSKATKRPFAAQHANMPFHKSSMNIRLKDKHILTAYCRRPTGDALYSELDLNPFLGAKKGELYFFTYKVYFPSLYH